MTRETAAAGTTIDAWIDRLSAIPNVGRRLTEVARRMGDRPAVVEAIPGARRPDEDRTCSFAELDARSERIAASLRRRGVPAGTRWVLAVPPGIDFVTFVFALLKARLVAVLIDPGMGRRHLVECLSQVEPDGFIGPPRVQMLRMLLRGRFPKARLFVTCGRRFGWGGWTRDALLHDTRAVLPDEPLSLEDPAAVIFTTGSTGPPKGVAYAHRQFARQVEYIQRHYELEPGTCDVAAFPLFGLFNALMGATTVFPEMDYTRPAEVRPERILEAAARWQADRSFGSPAFWNRVGRYCEAQDRALGPIRHVYSAGAPVPIHVMKRVLPRLADGGDLFTPYGATEALPVASIGAREVLAMAEGGQLRGRGTCVGRRFPGIEWKVIAITDEPLATMADVTELPRGEVGELMVAGEVVTARYVTRPECNALHKVADGDRIWHRMGDVGYLDESDRFWFCGRKSHRVQTTEGTLYTIPCESIVAEHPAVYRAALVGVGTPPRQKPVVIVEPWPEAWPRGARARRELLAALRDHASQHPLTRTLDTFFLMRRLPTDIRHNAKIFREALARWAARHLA